MYLEPILITLADFRIVGNQIEILILSFSKSYVMS